MYSFRNQPTALNISRFYALLISILVFSAFNHLQAQPSNNSTNYNNTMQQNTVSSQGKKIMIHDQGLQMVRGAYTIPNDWNLVQDIATNPNTGQYFKYKLDISGPNGELVRELGISMFSSYMGQTFEQTWRQIAMQAIQMELSNFEMGSMAVSQKMQQVKSVRKVAAKAATKGFKIQCLEVPFSGTKNGQPYQGLYQIALLTSPQMPNAGTMVSGFVMAPESIISATLQKHYEIANAYQENPAFEQRLEQINQVVAQRMNAQNNAQMQNAYKAHQARMASNKAMFDATQKSHQELVNTYDAGNQQWMNNFTNSNSPGGYSGQDAFIDQIYERSTFADPYSGNNVNMDGQYNYNYTNGLGGFYGTDDANFDPNSLSDDWQLTDPLNSNY